MKSSYPNQYEIQSLLRKMWGRILTQVEVAMPPGKQCDQLKSLLKQHLRQFQDDLERVLEYDSDQSYDTASRPSRSVGLSDREGSEGTRRGTRSYRESDVSSGDPSRSS